MKRIMVFVVILSYVFVYSGTSIAEYTNTGSIMYEDSIMYEITGNLAEYNFKEPVLSDEQKESIENIDGVVDIVSCSKYSITVRKGKVFGWYEDDIHNSIINIINNNDLLTEEDIIWMMMVPFYSSYPYPDKK